MSDKSDSSQVNLQYDNLSALYASQTIISTTSEEIMLEFSSGIMTDPSSGHPCLPIHTRIAMPRTSVEKLHRLLGQALEAQQ